MTNPREYKTARPFDAYERTKDIQAALEEWAKGVGLAESVYTWREPGRFGIRVMWHNGQESREYVSHSDARDIRNVFEILRDMHDCQWDEIMAKMETDMLHREDNS